MLAEGGPDLAKSSSTTFLLADNESALRKAEAGILRDMGYGEILQATDGTQAWSMFKNFDVNFVISAWDMPEMNGLLLLKVIRADVASSTTPVVLVVQEVTKSQVIEAGEAGVTGMLIRPFTPDTFKRKIEEILRVEEDPQSLQVKESFKRGLELMNEGKYEEALAEFKRVLNIYENAEVYYNLGYIKTAQGRYEEAIIAFRRATQINNAFAQAYQKMAEAYVKLGRDMEAQQCLEKAAEIYMEKHMDESAEAVLMEAMKLNPSTINIYNSLGILYRRQGKYEEAIKQYRRALRVNPFDENIHYNLSRVLMAVKDFKGAAEILRKAVELNPDFIEARDTLKSIEMGEGLK